MSLWKFGYCIVVWRQLNSRKNEAPRVSDGAFICVIMTCISPTQYNGERVACTMMAESNCIEAIGSERNMPMEHQT